MIKIVTGYADDQKYSVPDDEAHKAYYLFLHPAARAVFSNGVAVVGRNIQNIVPDYHSSMGWNAGHRLDGDDWNEIRASGTHARLERVLRDGATVASRLPPPDSGGDTSPLSMPLAAAARSLKLLN